MVIKKFNLDKRAWTDLKHFWAGTCASIMPKHWQNWWVSLCPFDEIAVQTDVLVLHRTIGGHQCSLKVRKIEKEILMSSILPKSQQLFPLASKKWLNQNNKCTNFARFYIPWLVYLIKCLYFFLNKPLLRCWGRN